MQLQDLDIFEGQIPERESNQGKKRVSKTLAYFIAGVIHESVPGFGRLYHEGRDIVTWQDIARAFTCAGASGW